MAGKPLAVLAFSGGLDTSFCVPYLIEKGYGVHTVFVDTGGATDDEADAIEARALELGAVGHTRADAGPRLWSSFVVPFVMGGAKYQGRYPLLCSDRYAIVEEMCRLAETLGAAAVAHGCTAMGNDQFRFDQSIRSISDLPILAPIRDIQALTDSPRAYEIDELAKRGFSVSADAKTYTINENILGATMSGSEIDEWAEPSGESYRMTAPRSAWPETPLRATIGFEEGVPVSIDGEAFDGVELLRTLNERFGAYGVGRGIYTGDTIVGLKGRIVFECPGLEALLSAHKALEELTLTRRQANYKRTAATEWSELVFGGLFFEPLREDLETLFRSTQRNVTGSVTLLADGGRCLPVAVDTDGALLDPGAVYAQRAAWTAADAEGFIRIAGGGSAIGAAIAKRRKAGATA